MNNMVMGYMPMINQNYATQSAEQSIWGQGIDDAYVWTMGGPFGRITINTERRNPTTPTATNPTNANFILFLESLLNIPQSYRPSFKLKINPIDATQYPSRTYNVFLSGASHNWNSNTSPELISFTFNFTRRKEIY